MIEETVTRVVIDVDWTDECTVVLRTPKQRKRTELTAAQAIELAGYLVEAAEAALSAAGEAVRPVEPAAIDLLGALDDAIGRARQQRAAIHPECVAGKCDNCDGQTMAPDDSMVPCEHPCHWETITPERAA